MSPVLKMIEFEGNSTVHFDRGSLSSCKQSGGWHYHKEFEICYILRGEGDRYIDDCSQSFKPGDLTLIAPNVRHGWKLYGSEHQDQSEAIVLHFNPLGQGFNLMNIPGFNMVAGMMKNAQQGLLFEIEAGSAIEQTLLAFQTSHCREQFPLLVTLLSSLGELKVAKRLTYRHPLHSKRAELSKKLLPVINYIHENLQTDIRQSDMSELIGVSPQYFSRYFKRETSYTFVQYLNWSRIEKACQQILSTDGDLTNIAQQCGFNNLSYFNKKFFEIKKETPKQYRERLLLLDRKSN
ncbi:AraC family transcriptional regulator [Oceanicoccus sp. KOV_DT_Chl]|uniref:AraC family transcriptional regulator n=1 Tax=Oceanicoccus sp. KOV_DT_Chl TaxID=1904639 RepID=UPI000C7D2606|nr:AraC family transcriptional regulator [Oceanicoccus sp. KOV_DT_Chl]